MPKYPSAENTYIYPSANATDGGQVNTEQNLALISKNITFKNYVIKEAGIESFDLTSSVGKLTITRGKAVIEGHLIVINESIQLDRPSGTGYIVLRLLRDGTGNAVGDIRREDGSIECQGVCFEALSDISNIDYYILLGKYPSYGQPVNNPNKYTSIDMSMISLDGDPAENELDGRYIKNSSYLTSGTQEIQTQLAFRSSNADTLLIDNSTGNLTSSGDIRTTGSGNINSNNNIRATAKLQAGPSSEIINAEIDGSTGDITTNGKLTVNTYSDTQASRSLSVEDDGSSSHRVLIKGNMLSSGVGTGGGDLVLNSYSPSTISHTSRVIIKPTARNGGYGVGSSEFIFESSYPNQTGASGYNPAYLYSPALGGDESLPVLGKSDALWGDLLIGGVTSGSGYDNKSLVSILNYILSTLNQT